jgi:DNA-binding MarR family transcriptional regulator
MKLDELASRHEEDYPSYELSDWYEALFPIYEVHLRVSMQVEQKLPLIQQFVLRLLDVGVKETHEIAQILGLDTRMVYEALENLEQNGHLTILLADAETKRREAINITTTGRELLSTLVIQISYEDNFSFCLDALTSEYLPYQRLPSFTKVNRRAEHQVPPYIERPRVINDLSPLQRLWRERQGPKRQKEERKELIDILGIEKTFLGYRHMQVLQFIRATDNHLDVQVYDGRDRSRHHEEALLKMEKDGLHALRAEKKREPLQIIDPVTEVIDPQLYEEAKERSRGKAELERWIQEKRGKIKAIRQKESSLDKEEQAIAKEQVQEYKSEIKSLQELSHELEEIAPQIEILSMTEHRPRLFKALDQAKKEVIIVSPWLNLTGMNWELRQKIEKALKRGVQVKIGYGYDKEDDRKTREAIKELERLKRGKKGKLQLFRFEDTHAKIVIWDDRNMITTSFNWLSFAGRLDWGNRIELGTLTRDPKAVLQMLGKLEPMFANAQRMI